MQLKGLAAIITGGASGMGASTAIRLSQLGVKVALFDVNLSATSQLANKLGGIAIECDVTQTASVENAIKMAELSHGPARICVNCAGIVQSRRMVNQQGPMPLDDFKRVLDVNLVGTFNVMRLAAQSMIPLTPLSETAERGVIINTASVAAFEGQIGQLAYSASKGGIVSMTLPAARELAQFGIRVMAVAPGLVDTPMFAKLSEDARSALATSVPFPNRLAHPEEFAMLIQHILENPMLNGEVIRLDGALRMQPK